MSQRSGLRVLVIAGFAVTGLVIAGVLGAGCGGAQQQRNISKKSNTRLELAKDFLSRQELGSARREAEKSIQLSPDNAEAHTILGLADFLSALNNFRLLEVDDCLTGVDAEGLRSEMTEFLRRADQSFGRAVELDPEYSEAWTNRGNTATLMEDFQRASESHTRAIEIPHRLLNISVTRANLGWAKFHLGDLAGAAKELRQALQFTPDMCLAKYRLGRVYFAREEWNKALEQFQVVTETSDCPIQEAHLYFVRTMRKLSKTDTIQTDTIQQAMSQCVALAPKSCIAARCQAGL